MQKGSTYFCIQWHLEPFCFHHSKFDHCYFSYNRKAQTEVMVIYLWILCQIAIGLTVRTSVKGQRGYAQDFSHRQPVVLFSRHSWISGYFLTTWPCIILNTLTSHEFIDKRTIFFNTKMFNHFYFYCAVYCRSCLALIGKCDRLLSALFFNHQALKTLLPSPLTCVYCTLHKFHGSHYSTVSSFWLCNSALLWSVVICLNSIQHNICIGFSRLIMQYYIYDAQL